VFWIADGNKPASAHAKQRRHPGIGCRQGRTAEAIRTILDAAGMTLRRRFMLEILE